MYVDPLANTNVSPPPAILVVDPDENYRGITVAMLERSGFRAISCTAGKDASDLIRKESVDLVISEYVLPDMNGEQLIESLKYSNRTARIPVIFVTSVKKTELHVKLLDMGADDYMTKPYQAELMLAHVRSLVRLKRLHEETEHFENVMSMMVSAVEAKDPYTRGHSERVSGIASYLGRALGCDEKEQMVLRRGGLVHDVGKVVVDLSFMNKPGKLDDAEWAIMKTHPESGAKICAPLRSALSLIPLVRHHHERLNGTGYPDGLVEDQIPKVVRILSVADVFDALTTSRPYRQAMGFDQAIGILDREVHDGCWDPEVVVMLKKAGEAALNDAANRFGQETSKLTRLPI